MSKKITLLRVSCSLQKLYLPLEFPSRAGCQIKRPGARFRHPDERKKEKAW
jgi:hypothetical protein